MSVDPELPISQLNYDSLTEPKRRVMDRIHDLQGEFWLDFSLVFMEANDELLQKACEIIVRYACGILKHGVLNRIDDPQSEIDGWFFDQ